MYMPRPKILLVDNDAVFLSSTSEFLEKQVNSERERKYDVVCTSDWEHAKTLIQQRLVTIAFIDWRIVDDEDEHDESGLNLARATRGDSSIPRIILTRFDDIEYLNKALASQPGVVPPANGYLLKREKWDKMLEVIETTLTRARVFLCYAGPDRERVLPLYAGLEIKGHYPWMDVKSIWPGQNWPKMIEQEIDRTDFFVACFSVRSVDPNGYMLREIRQALDILKEKRYEDVYFIPARLEHCVIRHLDLRNSQWVDLFDGDGQFNGDDLLNQVGFLRLVQTINAQMVKRWRND
jgi:CheY-like chemotaxis protein